MLDGHLQVALLALKDNDRVLSKLEDHLPAGAAGRARQLVAVHYSNGANGQFAAGCRLLDGGKDRRALSADGEPIRSVFHVAPGEDLAVLGENRGANVEVRIRGV